jgi:hypothetical protein
MHEEVEPEDVEQEDAWLGVGLGLGLRLGFGLGFGLERAGRCP